MSQQKVDQRKKEKYNRKKQLQKEKTTRIIYRIAGGAAVIAVAVWIGFSVYTKVEENKPVSYTEVNMDAVSDYLGGLD